DGDDLQPVQDAQANRTFDVSRSQREGEEDHGRRQSERDKGCERSAPTGPRQAEREADLAGSRTGQELAQRYQIGISALAQPFAPRHHLVAKIAQMGDGAAEGGETKLQEDAENLGDATLWLLRAMIHS